MTAARKPTTAASPSAEPKADLGPASPPPASLAVYQDLALGNVTVGAYGDDRAMHDLDLADRLGMKKLRGVRSNLILPLIARGQLKNAALYGGRDAADTTEALYWVVRVKVPVGNRGGYKEVDEFWLNRAACLRVAQESETDEADRVKTALVRVFILAEQGRLPGQRPTPLQPPAEGRALSEAEVKAGMAAIELALKTKQIDESEAAVRYARLIQGKLDLFAVPEGLTFQRAMPAEASAALANGQPVVVFPVPNETGFERASAIGARHGLSGQAVNDLAKEVGVHGEPRFGAWRKTYGEGGKVLNTYFVYNAEGVAAVEPRVAEAGAAKRAVAEAKAKKAARQPGLPLP